MNKLISLLMLAALTASAQLQLVNTNGARYMVVTNYVYLTIPNVATNVLSTVINSNLIIQGDTLPTAFGKINSSLTWLQLHQNDTTAATYVQPSYTENLLYSNSIPFASSNYWGAFTNVFLFESSGTAATTNIMSTDLATWSTWAQTNPVTTVLVTNSFTNYIGTNFVVNSTVYTNTVSLPLYLATLSDTSTGTVRVAKLNDPTLLGRLVSFEGQTLDLKNCSVNYPQQAASNSLFAAAISSINATLSLLTNGITTSIPPLSTNTFWFTNGVLKAAL